jgi:alkylhydroperoxidase/carboxymuconolactone decarboxylase family protein YurZ
MSEEPLLDGRRFESLFSNARVAESMRAISPGAFDAAARFWRVPFSSQHLTLRMKELVLFAMHATATSLNLDGMRRHAKRVISAGGTPQDLVDVLITIAGIANHALYASVPILEEEWKAAGKGDEGAVLDEALTAETKQRFIQIRKFWNADRDSIARQMPEYFSALTDVSTESWRTGPLTRKEREFICISVDCTVTHSYPSGLRLHIRNAIAEGATKAEIIEIFQLAGVLGLEGYVLTAEVLEET